MNFDQSGDDSEPSAVKRARLPRGEEVQTCSPGNLPNSLITNQIHFLTLHIAIL